MSQQVNMEANAEEKLKLLKCLEQIKQRVISEKYSEETMSYILLDLSEIISDEEKFNKEYKKSILISLLGWNFLNLLDKNIVENLLK